MKGGEGRKEGCKEGTREVRKTVKTERRKREEGKGRRRGAGRKDERKVPWGGKYVPASPAERQVQKAG